jgi:hypothetical protein
MYGEKAQAEVPQVASRSERDLGKTVILFQMSEKNRRH